MTVVPMKDPETLNGTEKDVLAKTDEENHSPMSLGSGCQFSPSSLAWGHGETKSTLNNSSGIKSVDVYIQANIDSKVKEDVEEGDSPTIVDDSDLTEQPATVETVIIEDNSTVRPRNTVCETTTHADQIIQRKETTESESIDGKVEQENTIEVVDINGPEKQYFLKTRLMAKMP